MNTVSDFDREREQVFVRTLMNDVRVDISKVLNVSAYTALRENLIGFSLAQICRVWESFAQKGSFGLCSLFFLLSVFFMVNQ